MPRFVYSPEGAEPKVWEIQFERLPSPEAMAIERATGMRWNDFKQAFYGGSMQAVQGFLWVLLRREIPGLALESVVFCEEEIEIDALPQEAANTLASLRLMPDSEKTDQIRAAEAALEKALEGELADPKEKAKKKPSKNSQSDTSGDS